MKTEEKMTPCYLLDDPIAHLHENYEQIALVSHRRHLKELEPHRDGTLIVTSDWMMWQECMAQGLHCIHHEWGLLKAGDTGGLEDTIYLRAADWAYVDGEDITDFSGVSLGRQFVGAVSGFIATYYRLSNSLIRIIENFKPRKILYFDLWHDRFLLDFECRRLIVEDAAATAGVRVVDRFSPVDPGDPELPAAYAPASVAKQKEALSKRMMRTLFELVMGRLSKLLLVFSRKKKRALCMVSWNMLRGLLSQPGRLPVHALALTSALPKSPGFLAGILKKGVLPTAIPRSSLSAEEAAAIDRMVSAFDSHWRRPASNMENAIRLFVRDNIFRSRKLHEMATQIKEAKEFLKRYRPDSIIVDGIKNPPHSIVGQLAHNQGIPVDYTWHAPVAPQNWQLDGLGCDPRKPGFVTRCLTWGPAHEQWLEKIGAKTEVAMIGNPLTGKFGKHLPATASSSMDTPKSAVVLQYPSIHTDLISPTSRQYEMFVYLVRLAAKLGIERVIYKLHPSLWRASYFRKIAERFGLDCAIYKHEKLEEVLDTVDMAIGPVFSGALLETLLSGKKHLSLSINPTTIDRGYYQDMNVMTNIDEIEGGLSAGKFIDGDAMLESFCAIGLIDDPVDRFWKTIGDTPETDPAGIVMKELKTNV